MNAALVSIIIPVFNRAHLISKTLDSVLLQTYTNWECILVDDGSIDETQNLILDYCKRESRIKLFKRSMQRMKGANSCRNIGFKKAKGKYIQWFDSDDIMHPDLLKLQTENLELNNAQFSICNFSFFRNEVLANEIIPFNKFKSDKFDPNLLNDFVLGKTVLNTQSIIWSREIVANVTFDETLNRAQDLDFICRVLINNINQGVILHRTLAYVRRHENSITSSFKGRNKKLIYDEIKVRFQICKILMSFPISDCIIKNSFKTYLKSLKYLLYIGDFKKFFKYITKEVLRNNFKLKENKLLLIGLLYMFTKRGIALYDRTINNL